MCRKKGTAVVGSVMVLAALAVTIDPASAGLMPRPAQMRSTGPCFFSEQLRQSVSARKEYLAKLDQATGGSYPVAAAAGGTVGEYQAAEMETDVWGVGARREAAVPSGKVDTFTTDCLTCHDGSSATAVQLVYRNNPFGAQHGSSMGPDHPVGMEYASYLAASAKKFKPIFGAGAKMVLVDGKVGCLTCHDPLNPERGHLVMSDHGSRLCLTCHNK